MTISMGLDVGSNSVGAAWIDQKSGKTTGDIPILLNVEQAQGESLESTGAGAEFDEVWSVLQAMQEQDEVLDDLIHALQAERRRTKGFASDSRLRERVEVLGPTLTLDTLRRAITTRCLARPWDEMFQWLVAYKQQHRHTNVPQSAPALWTELLPANDSFKFFRRSSMYQTRWSES